MLAIKMAKHLWVLGLEGIRVKYRACPIPFGRIPSQEMQLLNLVVILCCFRRLLDEGVDTIHVDVWTTLIPSNGRTPQSVWSNIAPPDARVWQATSKWGFSMNITFVNATTYYVRPFLRSCPSAPQ